MQCYRNDSFTSIIMPADVNPAHTIRDSVSLLENNSYIIADEHRRLNKGSLLHKFNSERDYNVKKADNTHFHSTLASS